MINESIAGRKIARTVENRTIKEAVTKGTIMTRGLSIVDKNNQNVFTDDQEGAEQFWDDISGKRLDSKLVKKAREEEMREVFKHNVYEKGGHSRVLGQYWQGANWNHMGGYR